jgi:hypothetical protein
MRLDETGPGQEFNEGEQAGMKSRAMLGLGVLCLALAACHREPAPTATEPQSVPLAEADASTPQPPKPPRKPPVPPSPATDNGAAPSPDVAAASEIAPSAAPTPTEVAKAEPPPARAAQAQGRESHRARPALHDGASWGAKRALGGGARNYLALYRPELPT